MARSTARDDAFTIGNDAYAAGRHGDFRSTETTLEALARRGPEDEVARAFVEALVAQRWHAEPERGRPPSVESLGTLVEGDPAARSAAALACTEGTRAALLAFDRPALSRWVSLHASLLEGGEETAEAFGWLDAGRIWLALSAGETEGQYERAVDLGQHASALALAPLAVEAMVLRAAVATAGADLETAAADARRASRMARTEELPQWQYLAGVVLSRVRRLTGRPHHSTRILDALAKVAPVHWHPWLLWELLLAGALADADEVGAPRSLETPAAKATNALWTLMTSALAGDRGDFDRSVLDARQGVKNFQPPAGELQVAIAAIDPDVDATSAPPELRAWCAGSDASAPPTLRGIAAHTGRVPPEQATAAYAVARPGRPARRVVGLGASLVGADLRLDPVRGRPGRAESLIAELAYAGTNGMNRERVFARIYGFEYEAAVHKNTFDVLIHRARGSLGDTASIRLEGDTLTLELAGSLVVPDPSCEQPLEDLLLRMLARRSKCNAREISELLGVPLRTAQRALVQLVDEGALLVDQKGRRFEYRVEDTTFSEPTTRHYVRPD
jgi:hypothetical protein